MGSPAERTLLRAALGKAGISVAGEFDTLADAQAGSGSDPIVVAPEANEANHADPHKTEASAYDEKLTPRRSMSSSL